MQVLRVSLSGEAIKKRKESKKFNREIHEDQTCFVDLKQEEESSFSQIRMNTCRVEGRRGKLFVDSLKAVLKPAR